MRTKVNEALKQHFRPEFLNRIDDVIVFHELSKDEVTEIIDLMMQRVRGQLEAQGLSIELTRTAKYLVVEKGYDPTMGARPLRRALQRMVEDPHRRAFSRRSSGPATPSSSTPTTARSPSGSWSTSSRRRSSWPAPAPATSARRATSG